MPKIKFIIFACSCSLFLLLNSCKKDWVCTCQLYFAEDVDIIIEKANKKDAEEVCTARAERPIFKTDVRDCTLEGKYKRIK